MSITTSARSRSGARARRSACDRFAHRAGVRERMAPPRLAEAPHQQLVGCVEKEHPARRACRRWRRSRSAGRRAPVAPHVERDGDVAHVRALERFDGARRARREEDARCSRSPSPRTISWPDSGPHRRDPLRRRYAANSYEALFARTGQRPHSQARAAHRGAPGRSGATSRSSSWNRTRRCTTPSARRPRLAGARSAFPPPRFGELKHEIDRLIHRIESFGCIGQGYRPRARRLSVDARRRTDLSVLEVWRAARRPLARARRRLCSRKAL